MSTDLLDAELASGVVSGIQGEVINIGLLSTKVRRLYQLVNIVNYASIIQIRNLTKLHLGNLITL
jgi:hypothetical protein